MATDWSNVTLLVTVARAFAAMIIADAPVSLIVSVPHEVRLEDATALDVILAETAPDGGLRAELEAFTQTAERPALIAFVPGGDEHVLLNELGRGLTNLHHLARHLATLGAVAASPPPRPPVEARCRALRTAWPATARPPARAPPDRQRGHTPHPLRRAQHTLPTAAHTAHPLRTGTSCLASPPWRAPPAPLPHRRERRPSPYARPEKAGL